MLGQADSGHCSLAVDRLSSGETFRRSCSGWLDETLIRSLSALLIKAVLYLLRETYKPNDVEAFFDFIR